MINLIWVGFFLIAITIAILKAWQGELAVVNALVDALFQMAELSVEIALGLIGILTLWLGFFRIAEAAGLVKGIAWLLGPLFRRLMPDVPQGHPALGSITMNMAANMLGLDNAATPMGLKAMHDLQTLNSKPDTATNAQILFLVLNTSSVTLLPITIFMYRAQLGAENPADIFLPIILATSVSSLVGVLSVAYFQRLKLWDPVVIAYALIFTAVLGSLVRYLLNLPTLEMSNQSNFIGNLVLLIIVASFLLTAVWRRLPVYELFIEGAKEGFQVAVKLIPYLVAMLVAIGVFRASGALDFLLESIRSVLIILGWNTEFVDALPTAFMKPFSGSGSRAMMLETMNTLGVDAFASRLSAIMQGSTETTFYVLTVYFGVVGITKIRYALWCGLLADFSGICASIGLAYWFF